MVLGDHQFFKGYTLFLSKQHKEELHELSKIERSLFLHEMAVVAESVYTVFAPEKLNYELLGNADRHMHWHLFPRYTSDLKLRRPVWAIDKNIREAEQTKPSCKELTELKNRLKVGLEELI